MSVGESGILQKNKRYQEVPMPAPIDHEQSIRANLYSPTENGREEAASVEDAFVPLPPGLRNIRLSKQEAAEIETILDDAGHPTFSGQEMPTADAKVLLEKFR